MSNLDDLKKIAALIRKRIVEMHARVDSSHIGSSFSCVDLLVALYFGGILHIDPKQPLDSNRDRLVLSKGHAASALYSTLALRGFFSDSVLETYCTNGGQLPGHVTRGVVPGVETSSGSLGHGLSIGVGMALGARYLKQSYRTYVILSDGECDEGSVWEAAMFAGHHCLDNLVAVVDYNKIQSFGRTKEVLDLEPLGDKWKAFGWQLRVIDGHRFDEILDALDKTSAYEHKPLAVIAHTVKGKGVSYMENQLAWHYKAPKGDEIGEALKQLQF